MASTTNRINVMLDDERAAKLRRLAERTHTNPGTLARSLLLSAIDEADPDPRYITDILDRIPGAWEDVRASEVDTKAGRFIPLEDL